MTTYGNYICAECGETFEKTYTDAEAWAADKAVFGDELTPEIGG